MLPEQTGDNQIGISDDFPEDSPEEQQVLAKGFDFVLEMLRRKQQTSSERKPTAELFSLSTENQQGTRGVHQDESQVMKDVVNLEFNLCLQTLSGFYMGNDMTDLCLKI